MLFKKGDKVQLINLDTIEDSWDNSDVKYAAEELHVRLNAVYTVCNGNSDKDVNIQIGPTSRFWLSTDRFILANRVSNEERIATRKKELNET